MISSSTVNTNNNSERENKVEEIKISRELLKCVFDAAKKLAADSKKNGIKLSGSYNWLAAVKPEVGLPDGLTPVCVVLIPDEIQAPGIKKLNVILDSQWKKIC